MVESKDFKVAIIDFGMGNLFSIKNACEYIGLQANITSSQQEVLSADAVILPGIGAFGDAMEALRRLDLIHVLREIAYSKPFIGICLGMQLLMSESCEFGYHQGLGIVKGSVVRFDNLTGPSGRKLKVPHVGWNRIYKPERNRRSAFWINTMLEGIEGNEFMYFVHSFYVKPEDPNTALSLSRYGDIEFCSSLRFQNIFACQFHPERSGPNGLRIYKNLFFYLQKRACCKTL